MKVKIKRSQYVVMPKPRPIYTMISKVKMMRIAKAIDAMNDGWKTDFSSSFEATWYVPKKAK